MSFFQYIDIYDVIFSAFIAFILTSAILFFKNILVPTIVMFKNDGSMFYIKHKGINNKETMEKCRGLFSEDRFFYRGFEYIRGMKVKIITESKKGEVLISGIFLGKNEIDSIGVITEDRIIICFIDSIIGIEKSE